MGATEVHGRYSCFCFISTPKHIPIHYHTVDGCEILHQLVDGLSSYNPIIYTVSCFIVTNSYPGWWFGFRVAIHSLGCHAALENYCQSKRSKPFCLRFRSQGFVGSRHDSWFSTMAWNFQRRASCIEQTEVLFTYFFCKDFDISRGHSLAGATLWNPGTPCGGVYLQSRHTGAGGGYICLWGSLGETYATFEP